MTRAKEANGGWAEKRCLGYVRVSTERQAGEGVSLDAQTCKIRAMAGLHDADLIEIITDAGESAKSLDRPGMARLLALVEARAVDIVIIAKLDRLTRSVRDLADLLDRFNRRGVALVSVAESLDTGSAAGRLVLNVMASVSQWEREAIGERTRDALRHLRAQGRRCGNLPYGFTATEDGRLIPHHGEQATIARVKALRAAGLSYRVCADRLNEEGHVTRRGTTWIGSYVWNLAVRDEAASGSMMEWVS